MGGRKGYGVNLLDKFLVWIMDDFPLTPVCYSGNVSKIRLAVFKRFTEI